MILWRGIVAVVLWGASCVAMAQPLARAHVLGKQPALVNQPVRIEVEILAPNYFTSAPPFPEIQIPGAIVTMPDERGQNFVEQIGGHTYAGILKTYVFTAQQAGDFTLPPLPVKFSYGGDDGKPQEGQVALPPTRISAKLPEGAAAAGGVAQPVARIHITQRFDHPVDRKEAALEAGDALVRTLDTFAEATQAMMIPPPVITAPPGVRMFMADPKLDDVGNARDGPVGGHRIDQVTYVFERPGSYTLPAIDVAWFDADANRQAKAEAPGVTVVVGARRHGEGIAPEAAPLASSGDARGGLWRRIGGARLLIGAIVLVMLALAARALQRRLPGWKAAWQRRQAIRQAGEPAQFEAVAAACGTNDPAAAYAALMAWSRRHAGQGASAWRATLKDTALDAALDELEARLFGAAATAAPWTGAPLLNALRPARARWLASRHARAARLALPKLNPGEAKRG